VGYTFLLAGFLKIMTLGTLAVSAPNEATRTAFGKVSSYLLVPVGLGLAWFAKVAVESGLNESKKFLRWMVAILVIAYFVLAKLLFKYTPNMEVVNRPRSRLPGPLGDVRSRLGDKELAVGGSMVGAGAGTMGDSRAYQLDKPDQDKYMYDDVAWYEGRYPSQLQEGAAEGRLGRGNRLNADIDLDEGRLDDVEELLAARGRGRQQQPHRATRRSYLSNNLGGGDDY